MYSYNYKRWKTIENTRDMFSKENLDARWEQQ